MFLCTWEVSSLLSRGKYAVEVFDKSINFVFHVIFDKTTFLKASLLWYLLIVYTVYVIRFYYFLKFFLLIIVFLSLSNNWKWPFLVWNISWDKILVKIVIMKNDRNWERRNKHVKHGSNYLFRSDQGKFSGQFHLSV